MQYVQEAATVSCDACKALNVEGKINYFSWDDEVTITVYRGFRADLQNKDKSMLVTLSIAINLPFATDRLCKHASTLLWNGLELYGM